MLATLSSFTFMLLACSGGEPSDTSDTSGTGSPCSPEGTGADLYVCPTGTEGGDGTLLAPFGTLSAALASVAEGGGRSIAVAPGTYTDTVVITAGHDGVEIGPWGDGEVSTGTIRIVDASVTIDGLDLATGELDGIDASGAATRLYLRDLSLRADDDDCLIRGAILVSDGALASLEGVTLTDVGYTGLSVNDATVEAHELLITGQRFSCVEFDASVMVSGHGVLTGDGLTVSDGAGWGVYAHGAEVTLTGVDVSDVGDHGIVSSSSDFDCTNCTVQRADQVGVLVEGGDVRFDHLSVLDIAARRGGAAGVLLRGRNDPSTMVFMDATIDAGGLAAMWISGEDTASALPAVRIEGSDLKGGPGVDTDGVLVHGNAIFAVGPFLPWDGATGLLVSDTILHDSQIGVLLDGASATLAGNTWTGNGVDLVQQHCGAAIVGAEEAPTQELCPETPYPTLVWPPDEGNQ